MGALEWLLILAVQSPVLLFWIAVIILAIVMLRRDGGRAELFLIAGAGAKILGNLLAILWTHLSFSLYRDDYFDASFASVSTTVNVSLNVVGMAGILLLLYAFWIKYNEMRNSNEYVENP